MVLLIIDSWKIPLMVFLFIASYHGQTALRVSQGGGSKVYRRFPKPSWCKRRMELAGPSAASDLGDSCLRVLVNVERGCEYLGPLTPWGCEGDLLWEFFERGWDSYSVRITEVYHVLTPPPKAHDRYIYSRAMFVYTKRILWTSRDCDLSGVPRCLQNYQMLMLFTSQPSDIGCPMQVILLLGMYSRRLSR